MIIFYGFLIRQCDWLLGDRQGGIGDVNEGLDQSRYANSTLFSFRNVMTQEPFKRLKLLF